MRALLLALTLLALAVPSALAQQPQAPGSPFGPLPQPAPTPPPTQTQTQTQPQDQGNGSSSDSGPSQGVLVLLFVAAIAVLGGAGFFIARDARRTVKPRHRPAKRRRTRPQPSGARAPGAPPPPPRKARKARKR